MEIPLRKKIENTILENYFEYQNFFVSFQSEFMAGLYRRYQGVENGNLVLYFAKLAHQDILRQKDHDLNFNLGFKNFWENHKLINPQKKSIIKVAKDIYIAKETARRKIIQLIQQKVLSKKNNILVWLPNEQYKESYDLFINKEIQGLSRLTTFVCKKVNLSISSEQLTEELKKNFSFYWFHYLGAQLEFLRIWNKQFNDLEVIHIFLQLVNLISLKAKKEKILYNNPNIIRNYESASISASSVSEATNISRATCVRKLDFLIKINAISQDKISKRYYIIPEAFSKSTISLILTKEVVSVFSKFYFICINTMGLKNSS